jgi:hypothetical protein
VNRHEMIPRPNQIIRRSLKGLIKDIFAYALGHPQRPMRSLEQRRFRLSFTRVFREEVHVERLAR